ncbi:MAG: YitT family protein [Bacteroidales bacterium]|nr:YitT family protein [Candidatus Cacconaster scatequi]
METKKILSTLKSYLIIALGLFCYTLAWTIFLIPNGLVGGGVTGISTIIQYCTGFNVSYSYLLINLVLILLALKTLGAGFGGKTVYAIIVTTIFLRFVPSLISPSFINDFALTNGKLLCAIIGGSLSGLGIAITFSEGGSSGGTDIIALIINKYRAISPGKVLMVLDFIIIGSSLLIPSDNNFGSRIAIVVYGYVTTGMFSFTVDTVISGTKQCVQICIFSEKYEEIANRISKEANRGVTVLHGMGWYSKQEKKVLLVVARKHDSPFILHLVREVDSNAFITEASVMGVFGQGFDQIKK